MTFSDMSCLVTLQMSVPRCNSLTVLTVPCGFLAHGNDRFHMCCKDHSISNGGKITVGTMGMLPWSLVLWPQRAVSMASVISAGRLGI